MRRPYLLAALATVAALAACTQTPVGQFREVATPSASTSSTPSAPAVRLAWTDCQAEAEDLAGAPLPGTTVTCATLPVPENWADPDGPTIDLALMRVRQNNQTDRIGSLLVNPGGPGGSGLELTAVTPLFLPSTVLKRFDIVGFDPRGVGRSAPIRCVSDQAKDVSVAAEPDPRDQAAFDVQVADARKVAAACDAKYGKALGYYSTEQTARDMDAIRAAVGDQKLTYLGYSYGTLLGAVYANLHPDRVRAMVLDGAVDPKEDEQDGSEGQAAGFERAFDRLAAACRKAGRGCPVGPDARASVDSILTSVRAKPVPARGKDTRRATAGHVLVAIVSALYSPSDWPTLWAALAATRAGNATELFALVDGYTGRNANGRYDNSTDSSDAVNCADGDDDPSLAEIRALQASWRAKYPLFGAPLAVSLIGCATWPEYDDPYPTSTPPGLPPVLVVGTVNDPATPYENTAKLADALGSGVVLTWQGDGHTAYPQTSCLRNAVDPYLVDLLAPKPGTTCAAN